MVSSDISRYLKSVRVKQSKYLYSTLSPPTLKKSKKYSPNHDRHCDHRFRIYTQVATLHHDHMRTRSGSTKVQRTKHLTSGMPAVTVVAGAATVVGEGGSSDTDADAEMDVLGDVDGVKATPDTNTGHGRLRDFLFGRPNKIFKSLMRTGVRVVQRGMDAFQGVSTKVIHVARKQIGGSSSSSGGSSSQQSSSKSNESGDVGNRKPVKRQAETEVKKPTGFVKSVAKMLNTGLTGIEHVTDLGLLLGNVGTHKLMATLNGKSGNQEIYNLIIKFVGTYNNNI